MEINFDSRGHLKPYGKIEISLQTFRKYFVDDFGDKNQRRIEIFKNYLDFVQAFKQEISEDFIHWTDGSFVTNKTTPRDIDFVTLLDYKAYEKYETIIENKFRRQPAKDTFGLIDAYFIKMYPSEHQRHWVSDFDLVYWRRWFSETKKNRAKKKFPKGFIEIRFGKSKITSYE